MAGHTRRNILRGGVAGGLGAALAGAGAWGLTGQGSAGAAQAATTAGGPNAAGRPASASGLKKSAEPGRYPFLEGAFAPVTEELTAFDLPVTGRIPRELNGRYLRNGPNALGLEDPRAHHWMLGEGMVHGVRLRDGRAEWYRNRWVRSGAVSQRLGERHPGPVPEVDFACNTCVIGHGGRILALQESGPAPYALDGDLNTVGVDDFHGTLDGAYAAHTKFDAYADELHAVAYDPTWDHVRHLVVDAGHRVVRSTRIPLAGAPMMHDFALTEHHVVLFDVPITFDAAQAQAGAPVPYVWNDDHPARVGVMHREGGPVRWFEVDPVYYSHTLNAYDDGDRVVVDLISFPAPFYAAGRGFDGPSASGTPSLDRWTIDLKRGRVGIRRLDDRPQEFPRVRETLVSRRHRYGYSAAAAEMFRAYTLGSGNPPDRAFGNALIKHDLTRGTQEIHHLPRGAAAGEAVFVPSSHGTSPHAAEDDGYTLAYVHNPDRGAADLLILSAQDFSGEPVARIQLPGRVPLGFHGSWVPEASMA